MLRAAIAPSTSVDVLREIAFAGVDVPVDDDGYAKLGEYSGLIGERFQQSILGECMVLNQQNPDIGLDSLQKLAEVCSQKSNEIQKAYESAVFVMAIFPKGFEDINGVDDDGEKQEEVEVVYPALFWSGNAIQLAVKTDDFVNEEGAPFVSVMLENLSDEPLLDTLMEFPNGGWPEMFTWEKYPLAAGMYHVVAKIYNGKGDNPDVREWTFEVKDVIENDCGDCWQMVALSNVDFEKYEWNDNAR